MSVNGKYENCTNFTIIDSVLKKHNLFDSSFRSIHYLSEENNYKDLFNRNDIELVKTWTSVVTMKI